MRNNSTTKRLSGKVAIVTGAGKGVGKAIAKLLAAEGAQVAVLSQTPANVDSTVAEIIDAGGEAAGVVCDVSNPAAIEAAVAKVIERFGGVDILVNNAHDTSCLNSSVIDLKAEQLDRNFATGPHAMLRFMQLCHPQMVARGGGRIINIATTAGMKGAPTFAPYGMAKEAVRALTRHAAREWGPDGITVNNVCPLALTEALDHLIKNNTPGVPAAPPIPIARYGSAEKDIAPVVLFLASDDGQYMTGYSLMADGGNSIGTAS